jgi:hypothetical protein
LQARRMVEILKPCADKRGGAGENGHMASRYVAHFAHLETTAPSTDAAKPALSARDPQINPPFDRRRVEVSIESGFVTVPAGLSREARRKFIQEIAAGKR